MTNHSEDSEQSGVSPLGPAVRRQKSESTPSPIDLSPAPPFSRSSRRDIASEVGSGTPDIEPEITTEVTADETTDDFTDEHPFGEILMGDDLDLQADDNQVDELPWLADLPEAAEAPEAERDAPEWLDWLDGVDGIGEGEAVGPVSEPEAHRPELPPAEPAPPAAAISSDDALTEIADRLEKIAASLRTGSAGTLLSEQSNDPLAALVAGYALGYARRRGEGSDR